MTVLQHSCRLAAVLILLLGICACATTPQTRQLLDHPPDIPPLVELEEVPFYAQQKYQCGPAALATVINFYQQSTSPEQLLPMVYIPQLKGSLQAEMLAAVRQYKLLAIEQDGQLTSILSEVAAGHPVLVLQNLGYNFYPFWHYAVIVGYDLTNQQLIMRSGEIKRLVRPFSVFERTWERSNYWSVVVVPPEVMPQSATQERFTQAAVTLEPKLSPELSEKMYQNGFRRWSQNYVLLMGVANAAFAQQDYVRAEALYTQATQLDRQRAEGWNNLAYAQLLQGKLETAISSVNRALELDPDNLEYQSSRREIMSSVNLDSAVESSH
jgi:tetratricopeptide (TPR) repeat protein